MGSMRDNANLAIAVQRIVTAFAPIYKARLIPPKEFIRLVYRFIAEAEPETTLPGTCVWGKCASGASVHRTPGKEPGWCAFGAVQVSATSVPSMSVAV
jgi:hypothetical protein